MAFSITFNSTGGSAVETLNVSSESITFYDILKARSNPTREGYVFAGWYDIQNSNVRTFPGLDTTYSANHELSAWWVPAPTDEYQYYVKTCQSNKGQPGVTSVTYGNTLMHTDGPLTAPVMQYLLWGKTINYIKLMMGWWGGQLTLMTLPKEAVQQGATGISPTKTRVIQTHAAANVRTPEIYEFEDFTIDEDEVLAVVLPSDGNGSRFFLCDGVNVSSGVTRTFDGPIYRHVGDGTTTHIWNSINIDLGYKSSLPPSPVTGVSLDKSSMTINKHSSSDVVATVIPAGAEDKTVSWSKSNNNISITQNGLTCTVTGAEEGDSVLSVVTAQGSFVDTCSIHVDPPLPLFIFTFKDSSNNQTLWTKPYYEATSFLQIYRDFYDANGGNPTREGYTFGGWFGQQACNWTMPLVQGNGSLAMASANQTYYAKWNPVVDGLSTFIDSSEKAEGVAHSTPIYYQFPLATGLFYSTWGQKINHAKFRVGNPGVVQFAVYDIEALSSSQLPTSQFSCDTSALGYSSDDVVEIDFYDEISVAPGQILAVGPEQPSNQGTYHGPIMIADQSASDGGLLDGASITRIGIGNQQLLQKNTNVSFGYKDNHNVPVTGITISPLSASFTVNETIVFTANVQPANAGNKTVLWDVASGNELISILTADNQCSVLGLSAGEACVRVCSSEDLTIAASASLSVLPEPIFTISFDSNGGSTASPIEFTKSTPSFDLPTPSKSGFHFVGWFENTSLLIGDILTQIEVGTQRDISVKAKWVPEDLYNHFCGKSFSFMGDSMTTFWKYDSPHNPNTIYTQYVCAQNGITEDTTYWGQIIQSLDGSLCTLDAIGTTGVLALTSNPQTRMSNYEHRINDLSYNGTPDVIFIFVGTNDVGGGSDGGVSLADIEEFDPTASYAIGPLDTTTTSFGKDITRAYTTMIRRIQDKYPDAEIVCMNPWLVSGSNPSAGRNPELVKLGEVAEDICDFYDVYYVNLMTSGMHTEVGDTTIDAFHPNNKGFTLIADYALETIASQVHETVHVQAISLEEHELTVTVNHQEVLRALISPEDATNKNVLWESASDKVSLQPNGLSCTITGISEGTASLSVMTYDGGFCDVCTVEISAYHPESVNYDYMLHNTKKIQVDSAIRDGSGRRIATKYIRTINGMTPVLGDITLPLSNYALSDDVARRFTRKADFDALSAAFMNLDCTMIELLEED